MDILKEFKNFPNDIERWKFVRDNRIPVGIDSDHTFISTYNEKDRDFEIVSFDECIGWDEGIFHLLKAMGILVMDE